TTLQGRLMTQPSSALPNASWTQIPYDGGPTPRAGHSAHAVGPGQIVVLGGDTITDGGVNVLSNEAWLLTCSATTTPQCNWTLLPSGSPPLPDGFAYHAARYDPGRKLLFVYGGGFEFVPALKELWTYGPVP